MSLPGEVQMGRDVCGDLEVAEKYEWLVTNGLGGFASGTVAGTVTRRYHGLLIAALRPPTGRTLLVSKIDDSARYGGSVYALSTNRWASGFTSPRGYLQIESFFLEGTKPVWRYALADALLEKRIWMRQGENTTYVQYKLVRANGPVEIDGKTLVAHRDFHSTMHASEEPMAISAVKQGLQVQAGATTLYLRSAEATFEARYEWYQKYSLPAETARGLDDEEDSLYAGLFHARLNAGESVTIVFSTNAEATLDGEEARAAQSNHEWKLFDAWQRQHKAASAIPADEEPSWMWQLVLAADQFIALRARPTDHDGRTIIAGYPWFADWGRDTMIALPGLTLATGRPEIARKILLSFAEFVDEGMLPNNFPDVDGPPGYNTVDAALWYFEAIRQYVEATQDFETLKTLYPVLSGIVDAHIRGTRYKIQMDPADSLLAAGDNGTQLTWMDAKIGDWVVTPRAGKPVEINALWINALRSMARFAEILVEDADRYKKIADAATESFKRFWNAGRNCCYDVIDTPRGENDESLRPNQIFAVSLPHSPLTLSQQTGVVDACAKHLLTSHGLRSLAPGEPGYKGQYGGGMRERDSSYHQGTVWAWLLGPFALAHFRVYGDAQEAQSFLDPLGRTIYSGGLGTIGEIFGGDAPFLPAGCIAEAWSVAEVFRAWELLSAEQEPEFDE